MPEWYLLLSPVVVLVLVWMGSFVACSYLVDTGGDEIRTWLVRLRFSYPLSRPIKEVYFRLDNVLAVGPDGIVQGGGYVVALKEGSTTPDSTLPVWRLLLHTMDRTPTLSDAKIAQPTPAGTGEFSVLIAEAPTLEGVSTWQVKCDAYTGPNKTGTQYLYYDDALPFQKVVSSSDLEHQRTVTFPFVLTTTEQRVIPDLALAQRPPVILHLDYTGVKMVITQVEFTITVDGDKRGPLTLLAGGTFKDETGFSNPDIHAEKTDHNTQTDSGEWQARIKFPPLGDWEVQCAAYRIDTQTKLPVVKFPAGGIPNQFPVTGIDPLTEVHLNFRVNHMTDTVDKV